MKAFVTGGTGFIGSHLVDFLIQEGVQTKCLVRKEEKWLEGRPYIRIPGDLHDLEAIKKGLKEVDVLFHLAGLVMAKNQETFDRINVEATENIVRLAQKIGVPKIVVFSSLAAVGPATKGAVDETSTMKPITMYGRSKKKMELKLQELVSEDSSITIIRPPAVYGPREEQIYLFFKIASHGLFPMIGNGEFPRISLVHVRDVVNGAWLAANHEHKGVEAYFISSEEIYNWKQIKYVTGKALDKRLLSFKIQPGFVRNLASVFEKMTSLFGHYPVFNTEKANEMILEWTCSVEKAKKELHYHQEVGLTEGLFETIMWYKKHHWL